MGWLDWFTRGGFVRSAEAIARDEEWQAALARDALPRQVEQRLRDAGAGRAPWVASMTPAELLIARSHGCRPIATVSGTCWYSFGRSWTEGHAEGWARALNRIREEAYAAGANAIVDVQMRRIEHGFGSGMDFTLLGTAVKIDGLKPSRDPIVATVPALEFVRLLEMGIVPVGLAIGARFRWMDNIVNWGGSSSWTGMNSRSQATQWATGMLAASQPLWDLSQFWEEIRRDAHADLRRHAAAQGNGVLANIHFGQLIRQERDKQPPNYLGRHIVLGTVVDTPRGAPVPHGILRVADMRDPSPLDQAFGRRNNVYSGEMGEGEGAI